MANLKIYDAIDSLVIDNKFHNIFNKRNARIANLCENQNISE